MAKKKKSGGNALFEAVKQQDAAAPKEISNPVEIREQAAKEAIQGENPLKEFRENLPLNPNAADRAKLEIYDKLVDESKAVYEEKEDLTAKVAEYIEEADKLREENAKLKKVQEVSDLTIGQLQDIVDQLQKENVEMQKQLDFYHQDKAPDTEVEELKAQVQMLKDENDKYLLKISELSFQNAKLMSQNGTSIPVTEQLATQQNAAGPAQQPARRPLPPNVKYVRSTNGYDSWN